MSSMLQFVFQPDVQEIFDHFCALFGIRIAFFSPAGDEMQVGQGRGICRFCGLLRDLLNYRSVCLALDRRKRAEARAACDLIAYECHGGMTEAIMPVLAGGKVIGYVMIGQFRSGRSRSVPAAVMRKWRRTGLRRELQAAFESVPYVEPAKLAHVLAVFKRLVELIVAQRMIRVQGRDVLRPVLDHLQEHMDGTLSLRDAASLCGRSPSSVSHLFRKTMGVSFKQYQVAQKLGHAEQLLRADPAMTVREAAFRVGYADPLYFSRLFRRHRGCPPSRVRNSK